MTILNTPIDHQNASAAARRIWQSWQTGTRFDALDQGLKPQTPADGYAVQSELGVLQSGRLVGWKIAGTAEAGRKHINVPTPLGGRMFESMVHADGANVNFSGNYMAVAEAEIVLVLAHDIVARSTPYEPDEIAAAVGAIRLGIEFPDSRFTDFTQVGLACLIADNACARDFVLGPEVSGCTDPMDTADLATTVEINGEERTRGRGSDALDGPLLALVWLANTLGEIGVGLSRGQFVTTGVTGAPVAVVRGDEVRVTVGDHASASARLV